MIALVCLAVGTVGGLILGFCISELAQRQQLKAVRKFLAACDKAANAEKSKFDGTWI